jgi:WD40 repeat protein
MSITRDALSVLDPMARHRRRALIGSAVVVTLGVVFWLTYGRSTMSSRAVLRGVGDTWPLAFSPDGTRLATSGTNGITVWDVGSGRERAVWVNPGGAWAAMGTYAPDGRSFAAVYTQGIGSSMSVELTDSADGGVLWAVPTDHQSVYAMMFRDDGRRIRVIFAGSGDGSELVDIDTASGREIARQPLRLPGLTGPIAISADGRLAALVASPGIVIWDLETDSERARLDIPAPVVRVSSGAFSPDGSAVSVGLSDGSIQHFDLQTGQLKTTVRGHKQGILSTSLRFSSDGTTLAACGQPVSGGSIVRDLKRLIGVPLKPGPEDGAEVTVIDVASGEQLGLIESVIHPFFSPDGRTLAARDRWLAIKLFDVPTPKGRGPRHERSPDPRAKN